MDNLDKKIVFELQKNGRLSNFEIAEKVGLSPSPCLRRIKNLEKKRVISGYTAIVDEELFGYPVTAFVTVRLENQTIKCKSLDWITTLYKRICFLRIERMTINL